MKDLIKSIKWFVNTANYYYGFDFRNLQSRWLKRGIFRILKVKYMKPDKVLLTKNFIINKMTISKEHTPDLVSEMKKRSEYEMARSRDLYGVFVDRWTRQEWITFPHMGDYIEYQLLVEGLLRKW